MCPVQTVTHVSGRSTTKLKKTLAKPRYALNGLVLARSVVRVITSGNDYGYFTAGSFPCVGGIFSNDVDLRAVGRFFQKKANRRR